MGLKNKINYKGFVIDRIRLYESILALGQCLKPENLDKLVHGRYFQVNTGMGNKWNFLSTNGLCHNINLYKICYRSGDIHSGSFQRELFSDWSKWNGDIDYPIGDKENYLKNVYDATLYQNPLRIELAEHLLKRLIGIYDEENSTTY